MGKIAKIKILGLMSGTSGDGLSIALCSAGRGAGQFGVLSHRTYPYRAALQRRILSAAKMTVPELSALNFELGRLWAGLVKRFCRENRVPYKNIAVIGSHGQTVFHKSGKGGSTLQIGEPSFIAEETGRSVVSDFRQADMAAGGEGAPLIPFMDEYLFGGGRPAALQNIGGVGNISFVGKGVRTSGFDTGPGNSLMDTAVVILSGGKKRFDAEGRWAAPGAIDREKAGKLMKHPFFALRPPKSLDRGEFSAAFIKKHFGRLDRNNKDGILATLNYFTAASIALAFSKFAPKGARELIVSGGGALNPVLMRNLAAALPGIVVKNIAELGIDPLAKEPACFALLAWLALNGKTNHCQSATGALGQRILGKITL